MPRGEAKRVSWGNLLMQLKREHYSEQDLLAMNKEFQNLKKGKLSVIKYDVALTKKMKLVPHLTPTELSKVDKFGNGLLADYGPTVKLAMNLKEAIWSAMNVES